MQLVLTGTLRAISYVAGMRSFLYDMEVLLKDFSSYVESTTKLLREASTEEARRLNRPIYPVDYYWSVHQSEWATDILFASPQALSEIYPQLVRAGIATFSSPDVMRFLGKRLHGNYAGELISDYKSRPEGMRVKHRAGANSVKMYDKGGRILRVETTLNDPKPFKVFRPLEGNPRGACAWRPMRKGIGDLPRRARISQASK